MGLSSCKKISKCCNNTCSAQGYRTVKLYALQMSNDPDFKADNNEITINICSRKVIS